MGIKKTVKNALLPNPKEWAFWIVLALIFKAVIPLLMILHGHRSNPHLLGFDFIGDTPSYIDPIEKLMSNGHYYPDHRMPGYGIIYLFFRLFFSYVGAYNCIVILQLIISSVSVYCMALLTRLILRSQGAFYVCFYIFLISTYSNYYDVCLMTESLCTSFLIFGTWLFSLYFFLKRPRYLIFSGLLLTWVVFLRPAFAPVIIIMGIILIVYSLKNRTAIVKPLLLLCLPFLIFDGIWIGRNYSVHHRFIPLANGIYYPYIDSSYMKPMFKFVQAWGGAGDIPSSSSAMSCFGGVLFPDEPEPKAYDSIPDYIYTSKFNKDSLLQLRKLTKAFMAMQKPAVDSFFKASGRNWNKAFSIFNERLIPRTNEAAICQNEVIRRFNDYTESIRKEKPFLYYVKAPLIFIDEFLFEPSGVVFKRAQVGILSKIVPLFYEALYDFIIYLGLLGMVILTVMGFKSGYLGWILTSIPLCSILVHPILVRLGDNRYLMPAWPFLIACAAYFIILIAEKVQNSKSR